MVIVNSDKEEINLANVAEYSKHEWQYVGEIYSYVNLRDGNDSAEIYLTDKCELIVNVNEFYFATLQTGYHYNERDNPARVIASILDVMLTTYFIH